MNGPIENLSAQLAEAVAECGGDPTVAARATLEPPAKAEFGDLATNAAMVCASTSGKPPREFAQLLGERLAERLGSGLESFDVAGPGFLNLTLSDDWYRGALDEIAAVGEAFGRGASDPETVLVEFVSANPTGPLTAAGGRHAAYGDAIARLLEFRGHSVQREFYVNDAGAQVKRLGLSIIARARGEEVPEDGYSGDYVAEVAAMIPGVEEGDPSIVAERGVEILTSRIRATLERYGVVFDRWFSERSLHEGDPSIVTATCAALERSGHAFTEDGALWLRTTEFGDDKDRVLVRSDGEPTYFAADIAYHADKLARSDRLIDVLGADHHGYIARMKAAVAALDDRPERLEMLIMQFVHLIEGGDRAQMSKRRGEFVTLDELLDEVGVDAARWFMLQRSHETTVDLDLDLARDNSSENPVYYVQYAHARACSVIEKAAGEPAEAAGESQSTALHRSERALVGRIASFPGEVAEAAAKRAPHRICAYSLSLAQEFTAFYRDCRIAGAPEHEKQFRLALAGSARDLLATSLGLLGVSAPERL